jgi:hypothetical protein
MLSLILLVFAFVLFILAGLGLPQPTRFNFIGWGLAFLVLAELLGRSGLVPVR